MENEAVSGYKPSFSVFLFIYMTIIYGFTLWNYHHFDFEKVWNLKTEIFHANVNIILLIFVKIDANIGKIKMKYNFKSSEKPGTASVLLYLLKYLPTSTLQMVWLEFPSMEPQLLYDTRAVCLVHRVCHQEHPQWCPLDQHLSDERSRGCHRSSVGTGHVSTSSPVVVHRIAWMSGCRSGSGSSRLCIEMNL